MIFFAFDSQEKRREYGGSAFIEIQYCRMPKDSAVEVIVAVENIEDWKEDSLYVYIDQIEEFALVYGKYFDHGTYSNMSRGEIDIYGINYYNPDLLPEIIERIQVDKPAGHEKFVDWLEKAKNYNGFYILGI